MLRQALGEASARHLHELAAGRDPRPVSPERVEKSVSNETTFDVDISDPDRIRRTLLGLANRVGARLRGSGQAGRTVAIKVRLADFRTLSRSKTLAAPTDVAREIFDVAWGLYEALRPGDKVRLLGVRVEGLSASDDAPRQLTLGEKAHGWRDAERAADAAAARFGSRIVRPASLLSSGRNPAAPKDPGNPAHSDNLTGRDGVGSVEGRGGTERDFDPLSDPLRPS
jgi:DNA polymerase-4